MKSSFCPVVGGALAYREAGSGPPLVLIHGFSFDMRAWDRQVDRLAERHRVILYDLRGFGRSGVPSGPYSHEADLASLLASLNVDQPVLLGLSLGANVALGYSIQYPDSVRALILASPGLAGFPWNDVRPPDAVMAHAAAHGTNDARSFWLGHPLFAPLRRNRAAFERLRAIVSDYSGWHWAHDNPVKATSAIDRLQDVAAPTLILSGDLDVAGYRAIADLLVQQIPEATLCRFGNAGHVLNEEADAQFVAFVQRIRRT